MAGVLLWDFDGTLAHRDGMWSGALLDALMSHYPARPWSRDELRPHLAAGFPWHEPDREHFDLVDAEAWWAGPLAIIGRAAIALGLSPEAAVQVALSTKANYLNLANWRLADGALDVLSELQGGGWENMIVSNHVPELPQIVSGLGLGPFVKTVFCSASIGVEKPNPKFFRHVLSNISPQREIWVIGDSVSADIVGAVGAGLRSILVGGKHPAATIAVDNLKEVPRELSCA